MGGLHCRPNLAQLSQVRRTNEGPVVMACDALLTRDSGRSIPPWVCRLALDGRLDVAGHAVYRPGLKEASRSRVLVVGYGRNISPFVAISLLSAMSDDIDPVVVNVAMQHVKLAAGVALSVEDVRRITRNARSVDVALA